MKYIRPEAEASIKSWVSIWLGCIDAKFYSNRGAMCAYETGDSEGEKKKPPGQRITKSLHQQSCGEGFDHRERCVFTAPPAMMKYLNSQYHATPLGANPREFRDWVIRKKLSF